MDVASLDISVKATGLRPAVNSLEALGKAASTYKNDIAKLEKNLQELAKVKLPTLGKGITQFKTLVSSVDGLKGATTSFSKLALATDKLISNSQGLKAVAKSLESIKNSAVGMSGVKLSGLTGGGSTSGASRTPVDQAAKQQQTLMRQIQREGQMASVGYDKAAYLEQRAAMLGVSEAAKPYIAQMRAASKAVNTGTISQKQYNAALRMVPAQFTDIATQLAGGQNPFLIMLQQGGQLRDMFGSVSLTLRAVGSELLKLLRNPIVLAAAAVAALGYAFIQASNSNTAFTTTAVKLGGSVESNTIAMKTAASSAAAMAGSVSDANTVVQDFAARSVVSNSSLTDLTATTLKFSSVVGVDLNKAMAEYIGLNEVASTKILDLDKNYHFLTTSVYAQILAYENEGKQVEAVALANEQLKRAQENMTTETLRNLGSIDRAWLKVKETVRDVIDSIMSIGKTSDAASEYAKQLAKVKEIESDIKDSWIYKLDASGTLKKNDEKILAAEREKLSFMSKQISAAEQSLAVQQQQEAEKRKDLELQKQLESGLYNEQKLRDFNLRISRLTEEHWKTVPKTQQAVVEWERKVKELRDKEFPTLAKANKENEKRAKAAEKAATKEQNIYETRQKELNAVVAQISSQKEQTAELENYGVAAETVSKNVANMLKWQYAASVSGIDAQEKAHAISMANAYAELEAQSKINTQLKENSKAVQDYAAFHATNAASLAAMNEEYAQEVAYLTMTNNERSLAKSLYDNEIERKTKILELEKSLKEQKEGSLGYSLIQKEIDETNTLYQTKANLIAATSQLADKELSFYDNLTVAFKQYKEDLGSTNSIIQTSFTSVLSTTQSAVESFVSGTSTSFKDLAVSVLKSISVMLARIAILKLAMLSVNMINGGAQTSTVSSAASTSLNSNPSVITYSESGNAFNGNGVEKFAKGGSFTNSVVSSPTPFKFASGGSFSNGLMGEAGPEAVIPLTRMANGNLGVETSGNSNSGVTQNNVSVNVTVNSDGSSNTSTTSSASDAKKLGELIAAKVRQVIVEEQRPRGLLAA